MTQTLTPGSSSAVSGLAGLCWLAVCAIGAAQPTDLQAHVATYVRSDSDHTTVVSPRVQLGVQATPDTRVDLVYTVDVWTSASVDIRTAATPVVTEQRDELDVAVSQQLGDLSLAGSYRYSTENDYRSHGGSLGASLDLAQKNTTLALGGRAYLDEIWRSGDPHQRRRASTAAVRASVTQILDPETFVQLVYELTHQSGYLSSPYRYVRFVRAGAGPMETAAAVDITTCADAGPATFMVTCRPENNPDRRVRHAVALYGRRALLDELSIGASYRYYSDDWSLSAHTARFEAALRLGDAWLVSAGYRFYHQTSVQHYAPFYELSPAGTAPRFTTSDKELSELTAQRLDVEAGYHVELDPDGSTIGAVLLGGPTFYRYPVFPLLDSITAFELTLALEAQL